MKFDSWVHRIVQLSLRIADMLQFDLGIVFVGKFLFNFLTRLSVDVDVVESACNV